VVEYGAGIGNRDCCDARN